MFPDDLNQKASGIWDRNAGFWDGYFQEGNDFHRLLVSPAVARLLELQPGEQVLDVACGNGALGALQCYAGPLAIDAEHGLRTQREGGGCVVGERLEPQEADPELVAERHHPAAGESRTGILLPAFRSWLAEPAQLGQELPFAAALREQHALRDPEVAAAAAAVEP